MRTYWAMKFAHIRIVIDVSSLIVQDTLISIKKILIKHEQNLIEN